MNSKLMMYLLSAVVLISVFVVGAIVYKNSQKESLSFLASKNSEIFVRDYSPRMGNPEAKVILTEFLDPECESCRTFYPIVKGLLSEFDNKVMLVVRYAPFHRNSKTVVKALEAARMQGKYWPALDILFYTQPNWGSHHNPRPELIFEYLPQVGLDMAKLKEDMNSAKIQEMIAQDERDLNTLNIRGTPTFFVNGKKLENFGESGLRELLRSEIELQYGKE